MIKKSLALIFCLIPLYIYSQFSKKKIYNIEKHESSPKIDGELNDLIWKKLDIAQDDKFK